jgi:hypothetical protein
VHEIMIQRTGHLKLSDSAADPDETRRLARTLPPEASAKAAKPGGIQHASNH